MASKRTNERSTLHIGVRYDTSDAKRDIRGLIDNFELLQKESQIDVGLKNIEGVGGAIHEFKTLDGQLTDIADDSKLAGKQIDENISKAVNSAIDNISTLTGKTNDLLDLLRKIGRGEGSSDDIKKLATDLQANLGLLGVKFDANEILGMKDVQQQFEALSKGVVQFASTWGVSAQGVIESNLGISGSLKDATDGAKNFGKAIHDANGNADTKDIDKLKEKLKHLKDTYTEINDVLNKIKNTESFSKLSEEEVSVLDDDSANKIFESFNKAKKMFDSTTNLEEKKQAAIDMVTALKESQRLLAYEEEDEDGSIWEINDLIDPDVVTNLGTIKSTMQSYFEQIKMLFKTEIADIEKELEAAGIEIKAEVNIEPQTPKKNKTKKRVQEVIEQSVPEQVETTVEVEVDAKPKIDDTKIINNLEDALKKFRDSKRKDNVASNEAAQLVLSLKDLGYGEDDIKQRLSTNGKRTLASDAMAKAITQAEQLRKQLPTVSVEVDKLNRLLGEDVSADDKFKSFVKAVDSGEMSVEEAHNAITAMKKELAKDDASPGIDKLKNALKQIFKIKDLDELQASWKETVAAVGSGSKDWVDALADISKEETNIRNLRSKAKDKDINKFKGEAEKAKQAAADAKKEARKAQDELESLKRQQGSNIKLKVPKSTAAPGAKPKDELKDTEDSYKKILDIVNQIAVKEKEIQNVPIAPNAISAFNSLSNIKTIDDYKQKIQEVFQLYYQAKKNLNNAPNKDTVDEDIKQLEQQIASLIVHAEQAGLKLEYIFNGTQLKSINSKNSSINQYVNELKYYLNECSAVVSSNNEIEMSINSLKEKLLEMARVANLSEDAYSTIVNILSSIHKDTDFDKLATDIGGLFSGDVLPQITIFKEELSKMFPDKNIDELTTAYKKWFNFVQEGSFTAVQALEKIKKKEEEITAATKVREEAQRKANEMPKVSGTDTGGYGTGTGSGSSTSGTTPSQPKKPVTTPSVEAEIKDLEKLEGKVKEVETTIRTTKTQAFLDEQQVVENVVAAEKIKLGELESKIVEVGDKIVAISRGADDSTKPTLSLYDQILDKVKQAKAESEKIQHSPPTNTMFEFAHGWTSHISDIDEAKQSIDDLLISLKHANELSNMPLDFTNSSSERVNEFYRMVRATTLPDAVGARTWDELIESIQTKILGLMQFLQKNNVNIFDELTSEQFKVVDSFDLKPLFEQMNRYFDEMNNVQNTNFAARDSLELIVNEILEIASSAGMAQDKVQDLKDYLYGFRHMFPQIGDANETTNKILDHAGLSTSVSSTINEKTTAFQEEQSTVNSVVNAEIQDLNRLKKAIEKVTAAVNYKTKAFKEEQGVVNQIVGSEIGKLSDLKDELEKEVKIPSGVSKDENDTNNAPTIDSTLSSTLLELQKSLSAMIGSTDPTTQNTDADKGLSGIAKNVKAIYEHLIHEPEEKKPIQNDGVEDATSDIDEKKLVGVLDELTQVISKLQSWLNNNTNKDNSDELNEFDTKVITPLSQAIQELRDVIKVDDDKPTANISEINSADADGNKEKVNNSQYILTDPQGNVVTAYRGIDGAFGGLISNRYHGGTFSTDALGLAKSYAGEIGKIEKINLSMKNPLEIDCKGAYWDEIEFFGSGIDETSKRILFLQQEIEDLTFTIKNCQEFIDRYYNGNPDEFTSDDVKIFSEDLSDAQNRVFDYQNELERIYSDESNPYGAQTQTNIIAQHAPSMGYDGVIFKNIVDTTDLNIYGKPATVMVTFDESQIHRLETISASFENGFDILNKSYGDINTILRVTDDDIDSWSKKLSNQNMSDDEKFDFIKNNPALSLLDSKTYLNAKGKFISKDDIIKTFMTGYVNEAKDRFSNLQKVFDTSATNIEDYHKEKGITTSAQIETNSNNKDQININIEELTTISKHVQDIYHILNNKKNPDEQFATALKESADGLKDVIKYIGEDAKNRNTTNQKYMDSANRISTAEGRRQLLDQALTATNMKQVGAVDYTPLSNGSVKVSTVVEDTNGKLYDFAATVDKVGQSVAPLVENGRRSQRVIEERRKALEAQTVAEQKATQVSEEKLANGKEVAPVSNGTMSLNVLDGVLKSTTKMYDDYSAANVGYVPDVLKDEYSDLLNLIKKIKEENRNLEKSEVESIEKTCKAIQNKIVLLGIESQNYDEKLSKMKDSTVDNGTSLLGDKDAVAIQKNFDEIEGRTKKLQAKLNESDKSIFNREELKQEQKELDNLIAKTEKLITTAKANKSKGALTKPQLNQFIKAESAYNESDANSKQLNLPQEGLASLDRYKQKYQELVALKEKFQSSSKNDITEDDIKAWSRLTQELKECREEYEVFEKVASSDGRMMFASDEAIQNTESLKDEMMKLAKASEQGKASAPQWADEFNKLTMTFEDADHQLKTVVVTYDGATNTLTKSIAGVKQTQSAWEKFSTSVSNKMREMGAYFATFVSFYEVVAVVRQGVTYIRDIDSALTELKKVTDETDESYNRFLQTMSKTAGSIGSTVKDLTSSAADWARLGYTMEEAGELAKNTAILMNVSEFDNVNDATDSLVSTMQAFKYEASESMDIINMLNQIGNNYAISTSDLASSLMRSSGALQAANNSLAESVALTTAANTTMQDPESVGNALKVVSMRIRGVKTDLEEAGEETEGMVTNTAKLQEKIEALTNVDGDGGVNILTDTGAFKSTYQIISEIGKVWAQMDDMSQAALLEMLAGKQRSSVVAALLNDAELLQDIYDSAIGSSGSATHELNIYLDSIQGKIDTFNNSLQTLWMNTISSDTVKGFVGLGTAILDIINKVGSLKVAIAALFGFIFIKYKAIKNETGIFNMLITSLGDFSGKKIKGITTGLKSIVSAFTSARGGAAKFKAAIGALGTAMGPVGIAIAAITAGLIALTWAWNNVLPTNAKFTKDLKEATDELTEIQNKLESLNNEFATTKSRIEELETKGVLSFTEEEELARLKAQNAELERQIRLEEAREKRTKQKQIDAALGAVKTDTNLRNKYVRKDDGSYGAPTGHNDSSDVVGNEWDQNLNALETATKDLNTAETALDDAVLSGMDENSKEFKALEKDVENAEKRVSSLNTEFDNLETDWQNAYGDIGYIENATTEQEKAWNEFFKQHENYLNRQAILSGTFSKSEYFNDMFNDNATDEAKAFRDELQEALNKDSEYITLQTELDVAEVDLSDARKELNDLKDEAEKLGVDLSKVEYGNINTNERAKLQWNEENLNKYKQQLISWFGENMSWEEIVSDFEGTYSTVLGDFNHFGEQEIPIAFTALLQTANGGVEYLDADTVSNYIEQIVAEATKDGSWTAEEIIKLDAKGIGNIKGLIADVGETAELTSQAMHFTGTTGAIADMTNYVGVLEEKVNSLLSNTGTKIQTLLDKHPAIAAILQAVGLDVQDLAGYFTQTGEYVEQTTDKIETTVTSLDALTASVEAHKAALQIANTITSDGQAISEDYYNTLREQLSDVTVAEEGFSDVIEEQNGKYIVKNVSLLNKFVAQSKNAQKATIQMAKAQAQLQYKSLVQQMRNTIIYMGAQAGAYSIMSQAVEENVWMMEDQLATLKQTIQQYALLELSLSKAGNAFDEYERAKERDAQLTYDDSMLEMLKTIDEGLLKNETGTEAFEYAVKAIVPEKFWKDIDDVDKKIKSIHDYIDGDNVFSRFFYVDAESGELDITTDNVREFVDLCTESGLFDGNSKDFALSNSVESIEDFADKLGVTEAVALAMLTALEKVDAKWGNILTEVTMTPFDRSVYSTIQTMAELNSQLTDGSITAEEYAKQMAAAEQNLDTYTQTAKTRLLGSNNGTPDDTSDDIVGFIAKNKQVVAAQEEVKKATDDLVQKQKEYNKAVEDGVNGESLKPYEDAVNEATIKVNKHTEAWSKLVEERGKYPTEYEIELVIADIDKEIEASGSKFDQAIKDNFHLDSDGYYVINAGVDIKKLEESVPGIKKYIELLNSKTEVKAFADTTSAEEDVNQFQSTVDGVIQAIENNLVTLDLDKEAVDNIVKQANKILSGIASTLGVSIAASMPSWMKSILKFMGFNVDNGDKTPIVSGALNAPSSATRSSSGTTTQKPKKVRGYTMALGNAHATGDVGLKQSENDTVVGELGPEMVVDPIKGVYYTVGENGTEMVDLPKGAIIYNHKQTEELMKNGYTSRGQLTGGLSFANGNAYAGISHGIPSYHPNREDKTSFANYTKVNTKWDDATSTLLDAADSLADASDALEDTINWIDVLFTRIENNISEQEAYLETLVDHTGGLSSKNSVYDNIFGNLYSRANSSLNARDYYATKAEAEIAGLPSNIQKKIRSGAIDIQEFKFDKSTEGLSEKQKKAVEKEKKAFEEYVAKIQKAVEYYDKISEYEQQYWTTLTEIADKAVQRQEEVANAYENEIGLTQHLNDALEAHNDLLEAKESFASEAYYDAQIEAQDILLGQYKAERKALQDVLDTEVALGHIKIGSQQWFDMQQAIYDVDDAIIDTEAFIEDLQNSINDLKWAKFDELINRFGYVEEEISNVIQLLSHDSDGLVMEELRDLTSGNWATDSGLTTIGMYAQEMERAQYVANQYAEAIKDLEKDYAAGKYNETEYLTKLNELIGAQYENIEKYHDAKDAIVELNEARVDAIRDGIEKEIDAYDELIKKKKELLDKEQDLHDFNNEIKEKEKDVADLRKQLAAMDGDTTAATTAKKKQLEAELLEAQKALEDSYYSHSMTAKQEALDKEFTAFEEEKNAEITKWEEWLTNTELVISESLTYIQGNTQLIYDTLNEMGSQYGLTLSNTLTEPWTNGQFAIDNYSATFETAISAFTNQLDAIVVHWNDIASAAERAAKAQADALNQEYNATVGKINNANKKENTTTKPTQTTTKPTTQSTQTKKQIVVGGKINAGNALIYDYAGDKSGEKQYYTNDPIYTVLQEKNGYLLVRHHKLKNGYTGWFKKNQVKAYAKGTTGVNKDQLALIDELGEELVVNTDGNGRLSYLSKGSGVVPSDLTEKLIDLALDPTATFENMVPKMKTPNVATNNFDINLSFDALVHADNVTKDTLPELQKVIRNEFNHMMKQVNNGIKRSGRSI